jgi:murein DD-endopeptidase MepM/ murein hydrolase activator NlpD
MAKLGKRWKAKALPLLLGVLGVALAAVLLFKGLGPLDWEDPALELKPDPAVLGARTAFTLKAADQSTGLKEVRVSLAQEGQEKVVVSKSFPPGGEAGVPVELPFTLEPQALGFQEGKAVLTVWARDRSWRNWFKGHTATLTREVAIDLVPLHLGFISVNHLLHAGGTGVLLYRLNKPPKASGVKTGGHLYLGYPNPKGAAGEYLVLFPLPREASGSQPVELVAQTALGEEVKQTVTLRVRPRRWRQDRLNLSEGFLRHVADGFPGIPQGDLLETFLVINRQLRQANHEKIRQVCVTSQASPLWSGAFQRYLGKPMARYGDLRTYLYQNRQVDRQVHLGEDLANLEHTPVPAANRGLVVLAEPLGIYGQTVILDHGLGVFSQYSHLSQMDVKAGDQVEKGQILGKTGATGLAGGDHLHFSMLLQGEYVDPREWWDPHWHKDQLEGQMLAGAARGEPVKAAVGSPKPAKGKKRAAPKKPRRTQVPKP